MPYCWDGLDNAARIADTGYGAELPRYKWTNRELADAIERLLADKAMHKRLAALSRHMHKAKGSDKAAELILKIAERG
jgi:UDP:flavonoid glycosyltransferase YjiC (YdhE family)